ncbi:DUF4365 domain-containing protein [Nocardiopsis aegyptia]|uniref:DUF4365 domain-containing protein n=1 Tax=Nocardiopsis aegyptia TaxID=220378 RepID=A0A7Z0JBY1_9ACTN|nr:DUF4365 domain-containing protein [Nocardiopsis aegyptia]NYJ35899.1 hypothetical protein [Nocardiopsis aegyptia]
MTYTAGCSIKTHETDFDGVDITLVSSAEYRRYYAPQFELQLKCTTQTRYLHDDHMAWPMKGKPFRKLTRGKRYIPAYLGVLLVPEDPDEWISVDERGLLTESRMYWQAATELATTEAVGQTRTVHLPRSNLFTPDRLLGIMKKLGEQEGGFQ